GAYKLTAPVFAKLFLLNQTDVLFHRSGDWARDILSHCDKSLFYNCFPVIDTLVLPAQAATKLWKAVPQSDFKRHLVTGRMELTNSGGGKTIISDSNQDDSMSCLWDSIIFRSYDELSRVESLWILAWFIYS